MTKKIIGKGDVSDDLYILYAWVPRSIAYSKILSSVEAHYRFGHPFLWVLKKLCPQFHNLPLLNCESCHFAKHHHSSLRPRIDKRIESIFELVHSNVCGPCLVTLKTGFWYFVTFVDDFLGWLGFILWRIVRKFSLIFMHFMLRLKHNLMFMYEYWEVIMTKNIYPTHFRLTWLNMGFFISPFMWILLLKIALLKEHTFTTNSEGTLISDEGS